MFGFSGSGTGPGPKKEEGKDFVVRLIDAVRPAFEKKDAPEDLTHSELLENVPLSSEAAMHASVTKAVQERLPSIPWPYSAEFPKPSTKERFFSFLYSQRRLARISAEQVVTGKSAAYLSVTLTLVMALGVTEASMMCINPASDFVYALWFGLENVCFFFFFSFYCVYIFFFFF